MALHLPWVAACLPGYITRLTVDEDIFFFRHEFYKSFRSIEKTNDGL